MLASGLQILQMCTQVRVMQMGGFQNIVPVIVVGVFGDFFNGVEDLDRPGHTEKYQEHGQNEARGCSSGAGGHSFEYSTGPEGGSTILAAALFQLENGAGCRPSKYQAPGTGRLQSRADGRAGPPC